MYLLISPFDSLMSVYKREYTVRCMFHLAQIASPLQNSISEKLCEPADIYAAIYPLGVSSRGCIRFEEPPDQRKLVDLQLHKENVSGLEIRYAPPGVRRVITLMFNSLPPQLTRSLITNFLSFFLAANIRCIITQLNVFKQSSRVLWIRHELCVTPFFIFTKIITQIKEFLWEERRFFYAKIWYICVYHQ